MSPLVEGNASVVFRKFNKAIVGTSVQLRLFHKSFLPYLCLNSNVQIYVCLHKEMWYANSADNASVVWNFKK